jgi:hypothetical protein
MTAKKTETPGPEPQKSKREKNPVYVVFRLVDLPPDSPEDGPVEQGWVPVLGTTPDGALRTAAASNRKGAVVLATQAMEDPGLKSGTFAVVPVEQFQIVKRKVKVEEVSLFE